MTRSNVHDALSSATRTTKRQKNDFTPGDCIAIAIRSAFPLPDSGAFTDLLAAIDARDR